MASTLRFDNWEDSNGTPILDGTSLSIPSSAMPAGSILQVVSATRSEAFASNTGNFWATLPGLAATITPRSVSSKIFVIVDLKGSGQANASILRSRVTRNDTPVYVGDAASLRPQGLGQAYYLTNANYIAQIGGSFLDSPASADPLTYRVQIGADSTGLVVYVNRTQNDRDNANYDTRVASSITLMEVAG